MIPGSREKRGKGTLRAVPSAPEVTLVGMTGARREARSRGGLYLERDRLIAMTEKPVIVMARTWPGEQTQIVRRPVRKASGRRWIFIFGGAATATLLAAWLGCAHRAPVVQREPIVAPIAAKAQSPVVPAPASTVAARPIVAPLAEVLPPVAPARWAARSASIASGRHSRTAPARIATSARLARTTDPHPDPRPLRGRGQTVGWARAIAHRPPAPTPNTIAWVDPFIDR